MPLVQNMPPSAVRIFKCLARLLFDEDNFDGPPLNNAVGTPWPEGLVMCGRCAVLQVLADVFRRLITVFQYWPLRVAKASHDRNSE